MHHPIFKSLVLSDFAAAALTQLQKLGNSTRFSAIYRRLYPVFLGDGNVVDSALSYCWLLEARSRACPAYVRPAVLVACFSVRDVHCHFCECYWNAVPADHSTHFCLHRDASLVDHVQCDDFEDRTFLFCMWTAKASPATRKVTTVCPAPLSHVSLRRLCNGQSGLVRDTVGSVHRDFILCYHVVSNGDSQQVVRSFKFGTEHLGVVRSDHCKSNRPRFATSEKRIEPSAEAS